MALSRLSVLNISSTNALELAPFFRELRDPQPDWQQDRILPVEKFRMDLLALRIYGTTELKPIFDVILGLDDSMDGVIPGTAFFYPPEHWIRERIQYWKGIWASPGLN